MSTISTFVWAICGPVFRDKVSDKGPSGVVLCSGGVRTGFRKQRQEGRQTL